MDKFIHQLFNDQILSKAANFFNSSFEEVKKVGGFENYIYGFQKNGKDYILRISHSSHRTFSLVEAELDFVNFLASHKAKVSVPICSINKKLVEKVECDDGSYFTVSAYLKALGQPMTRALANDNFFINYGKTIGQFHALTKLYQPNNHKRYNWDEDPLIINANKYLPQTDEIILERLDSLIHYLKSLPQDIHNYGLIHTDVHMGNFFVENNELCVFDFDDCAYMWFTSDIAIALFYYLAFIQDEKTRIEQAHYFLSLFMEGYHKENQLSQETFKEISSFLKLREIILYLAIYRTCDLEKEKWAQTYINFYRDRIINNTLFVDIDFIKYLERKD